MGGANRYHGPRRGSMQFWPRNRAKRAYARVRRWLIPDINETKLLGFLGYKAGMTHIIYKDNTPTSNNKGQQVSIPATIVECPPLKPLSIRFYKQNHDGLQIISEIFSPKLDKKLKLKFSKKQTKPPEQFDEIKLAVYTQPKLTGIGQKNNPTIELGISGKDNNQKLEFAEQLLDKDITVDQIFKENSYVDVHGITKGKGFQGTVKRFGVKIRQHKSEKTKRGIGNLGSWTPKRVQYTVPQAGRMGYHQRTEYNKLVLKLDTDPTKINPEGGFLHYGLVKNNYIIIKGSIPGPAKRPIVLTHPKRPNKRKYNYELIEINQDSKQ